MSKTLHDFTVKTAQMQDLDLAQYKGKVVVLVNVASKCGFTPQYTGLEALNKKYASQGLVILGFPCNQFGAQEPGDEKEIQQFCSLTYEVSFPIMAKIDVNGKATAPVYAHLKSEAPGILGTEMIKWNFTKFLVGKDGKVIKRYAPKVEPADLERDIEQALKA
jgi:glutathione peroxidase